MKTKKFRKLFPITVLAIAGLGAIAPIAPANPTNSQAVAQASVESRLIGHWQVQNIFFVPINVILTANGRGYVLVPPFALNPQSQPQAYEFTYQVNSAGRPLQIDIIAPETEPIRTIFEFVNDRQIRIELVGILPGEPRATEFTTGVLTMEKVSNLTTLPRNTEIANSLEARNRERESQARFTTEIIIGSLASYYNEKKQFTSDFKALQLELDEEEKRFYDFQIILGDTPSQGAMVTAIAKTPGLKSFTGVIYPLEPSGENSRPYASKVCETLTPSITPPAKPILSGQEVQCAPGSQTPQPRRRPPGGFF